jgi:hypothetical protein
MLDPLENKGTWRGLITILPKLPGGLPGRGSDRIPRTIRRAEYSCVGFSVAVVIGRNRFVTVHAQLTTSNPVEL